ncbi:MAG: hypothetical protein LBQ49_00485, partial [Rickettsiales bacterium]|nr:hypothetical protein [Rickettsiales bacterium]
MLQALLALSLVIAFLPAFVKKISAKNINRENIALVAQVAAAFDAGRAFVSEEFDNFPNGIKVFSGGEFVEKLEPFGLPLGFVPVSPIGQKISLIVSKDGKNLLAVIALSGGKINDMRRAEILSRIGFWGAVLDNGLKGATGGWEMVLLPNNVGFNPDDILVRVPEDGEFSELVIRSAKDPAKNAFHTDLDMDGNSIVGARGLDAGLGNISAVSAANFRLSGIEGDRKSKNEVAKLSSNKVWFQSGDGNPLTIQRADLKTGIFS